MTEFRIAPGSHRHSEINAIYGVSSLQEGCQDHHNQILCLNRITALAPNFWTELLQLKLVDLVEAVHLA